MKKKKMSVQALMEKHLGHIEPTAKLARQIHTYKNVWVSENSSMLTGG